ncbi:MAG TPA: hypothetical protein VHR45_13800 [Thermoanaerobaculia bacterium]|nr:hypothetical protein [Thermoanaerobaculia bacterium]
MRNHLSTARPTAAMLLACGISAASLPLARPALAHVTPNVELIRKGEFVKDNLPGAVKYLEKKLDIGAADRAAIKKTTGWTPSEEEYRIYVGRDAQGQLVGTAIFLWVPSEHGPVGVAVAFDRGGAIVRATVTDVASEPLAWVRPLLAGDGLAAFRGLALTAIPGAAQVAPSVTGRMSRYYAGVIAAGVGRAQALEQLALAAGK